MTRRLRLLATSIALTGTVAVAACGSDPSTTAGTAPGTVPPATTSPPGRWINGEPDWDSAAATDEDVDTAAGMPMPATPREVGDELSTEAYDTVPPMEFEEPVSTMPGMPDAEALVPLRAGSVDDNADYAGYLEYLARYDSLGYSSRPFDPTGRIVITVVGSNGLPVDGLTVTIAGDDDAAIAELRTTSDGQVVFLPAEYGDLRQSYRVTAADASADAAPDSAVSLTVSTPGGAEPGMAVDVLFLLDVTGSMGDEIAQLKATIGQVADRLRGLPQHPDIRFGMTLFRDEGDLFVTSTFDFTADIQAFHTALEPVVADGGGDLPEAVDEAFASALADPTWRDPASTVQLIFLVGDAAPQVTRQVEQPYTDSIHVASQRGVTVHVVAASQTDDPAEHAFREIAQGTGGRFVFLANGADGGGTATGPNTDIATTDYEELSLDDLVVRLVGEELAALTGSTFELPPQSTVPPTNPPEQ